MQNQKNRKIAICLLLLLITMLAFAGAADARTNSTDIESGDLVFVNEENLDVSALLASGEYNELRTLDGSRTIFVIGGKISAVPEIYGGNYPYEFYAYNASKSGDNKYGSGKILVSDLKSLLDGIYIKKNVTSGTSEVNVQNLEIVNTEEIQYYVRVKPAYSTQFSKFRTDISALVSSWYEFGYEADSAGYYKTKVKTISGTEENITGTNPTAYADSAEFKFSMNGMQTGYHTVKTHFKLNLPTISLSSNLPEFTASHVVRESSSDDFSISASSTSVDPGDTGLTVTMHGLALTTYVVSISPQSYLTFPTGISSSSGTIVYTSPYHLTITFGSSGTDIVYPIAINESATRGDYHIVMNDMNDNSKSVKITVNSIEHVPAITVPSYVTEGKLASGDSFKVTIKYGHPKSGELVSLYLRNGVGKEILLRDGMSFETSAEYTYKLSTRTFDKGSYTLIARASGGGTARISFYLAEPTLVVSSNVPDSHILSLDKDLEITYVARGSPGTLIWYMFGTNFRKSGNITLVPDSSDTNSSDAQLRSGMLIFTKEDLRDCDDGTYYFLVTHPGSDNNFTLTPQYDSNGNFVSVIAQTGEVINIMNRQAPNAVAALMQNLQSGNSDDLSVQESFEIFKNGYLRITGIKNMNVGDNTMTVEGITSAPRGKTVNLLITPISFAPEDVSNTAMQMKAGYTAILQENSDESARTFTMSDISTSTWYPGTYMAEFTIDDPKLTKSISFVLGEDGSITSSDILIEETADETYYYTGPTLEPTSTPVPIPTAIPTVIPTSTPTAKNPVPMMGSIAAFVAVAGIFVRRK